MDNGYTQNFASRKHLEKALESEKVKGVALEQSDHSNYEADGIGQDVDRGNVAFPGMEMETGWRA